MQPLSCLSLRLDAEGLFLLDQTLLPQQECWHPCRDVATLEQMIKTLQVRGAPMIALCCALLLAWLTEQGVPRAQIADALERLRATRPTAVNLMHAMERLRATLATDDWPQRLIGEAERLFIEDRALCTAMAGHGATLIANGDRILTHCNTGGLATAGIGTAIGVIRHAHELGRNISVWVDETRPLLQGGRLTAWELGRFGIPYRLICDSMAAVLMGSGQVDKVLVGADRIAANGDFANKIGTYGLAVLAHHHQIPFYVVAPHTTVDGHCPNGKVIPIEQRDGAEVRGVRTAHCHLEWSPADAPVFNPAFDVTPAALVTGWVLDSGLYGQADVEQGLFGSMQG